MMRPLLALLFVTIACWPVTAAAQSLSDAPAKGAKVLVTLQDGTIQSAKFVSLTETELVTLQDHRTVRCPLAQVRRIVAPSTRGKTWALRGLLIGIPAGILVFRCNDPGGECPAAYIAAPISGGMGAIAGSIIGAIAGRRHRTDRIVYDRSPRPFQYAVAPMLTPRRTGVALTVRW